MLGGVGCRITIAGGLSRCRERSGSTNEYRFGGVPSTSTWPLTPGRSSGSECSVATRSGTGFSYVW